MKKIALLINGNAGNNSLQEETYSIIENLAVEDNQLHVFPINPKKGILPDNYIQEHASEYDLIVCAGGDGTLNHLVNNIMPLPTKPILGYIPAGTTNDFARSIRIPSNIDSACNVILHGGTFAYDIGKLNDKYFNYVAAFGAFSSVSYSTEQSIKNIFGHTAYILSAIGELSQHMNYKRHMKVETDSFTIEDDFIFGAIFSSNSIGGIDVSSLGDAHLDDGKYEIILIKYPENIIDLGQVVQSLLDTNLDSPYLIYANITKASIHSKDIAWSIDGEYGGVTDQAIFEVYPKAIQIKVPKG